MPAAPALALLLLAACTPRLLAPGPHAAAPVAPQLVEGAAVMDDGYRLPLRRFGAAAPDRAVALALHGMNDYGNAFAEFGAALAAHGIAVYAPDQRGFGASEGAGRWAGHARMAEDADALARLLRQRHPGLPVHYVGESMGGAVAMLALARPQPAADGAVLSAPAVWGRSAMGWLQRSALWLAAHTLPWLPLSSRGLNVQPSDNIAMLQRLGRDPLVIKETRVDAVWGLVDLMDAAQEAAGAITRPVLVLYGERDEIIPRAPTCRLLQTLAAGPAPARVAIYAEGFHMLFRDLEGGRVIADAAAWMAATGPRPGQPPAAAETPPAAQPPAAQPLAPLPSGAESPPAAPALCQTVG
ncbi:MAG: alpha/beta hydrolase [Thalassobaculales bacterium]